VVLADLASLAEVRRAAAEILASCPRIDVLVNNAGIVNLRRERSADGLEATFAVNHLAPFLLTNLLLDRLRESAPARIVNVASEAHRVGRVDLDDLQHERRRYGWMKVYGASKLANLFFTYDLARRLEGTGVTANCLHPGAVYTGLARNNGRLASFVYTLGRFVMKSPERGAETSIHLACAPELERVTGSYFENRKPRRSSAASQDPELARGLWEASERLTGLAGVA
jgi:NAD(P)-dependent dehydrogenase (short-subunit alcohol dehydrogenase family)